MKTESKKQNIQQNKVIAEKQTIIEKPTESEITEVELLTNENDVLIENSITEISDNENSENESDLIDEVEPEPEVIIESESIKEPDDITEFDTKPEQEKEVESDVKTEPEEKQITEKDELSAKQKIKALQKDIENKKLILEKEEIKVRDWRTQAKIRDDRNFKMLEKKKKEAEELINTAQARYEKLKAGTFKWWWSYAENVEKKRIQSLKDAIATREKAIFQLQEKETEPAEN